jgi:subtilisin-like proprotein convertase family protein
MKTCYAGPVSRFIGKDRTPKRGFDKSWSRGLLQASRLTSPAVAVAMLVFVGVAVLAVRHTRTASAAKSSHALAGTGTGALNPRPLVGMTFTVTVANHENNGCDASCSLREAILAANANVDVANPDTINFNIPGGGLKTINLTSALPQITDPVIIDGYTQPGSSPNTLANGNDAVLNIELNGTSAGTTAIGIDINTDNCVVRGLVINRFSSFGIATRNGADNNIIAGNFVGTDPSGTIDRGNTVVGVGAFSSNNTIGGTNPADRNLISGNNSHGVQLSGSLGAANTNKVQGNFIGTDRTGTLALGNSSLGIGIFSSPSNTIGGTTAGARNVVAANLNNEIHITDETSDSNLVQGNIIGLDVTGSVELEAPLFVFGDGVRVLSGADNTTIGGATAAHRNIISGVNGDGIEIGSASSTGTIIEGNYIGTDISGTLARGNSVGVRISGVANLTVGGTGAGQGNLISGNGASGVQITGASATGNLVQGNLIGTDVNGTADVGNGSFGVIITGAANGNTIGGTTAAARNIISGNGTGVAIEGGLVDAGNNTVQGNYIGTDITGTLALANSSGGMSINFSPGNTVGGASAAARNIISGNGGEGVLIEGDATSGNNLVQGNFIGLNVSSAALGNQGTGVIIDAFLTTIGGTAPGTANQIGNNTGDGVSVIDGSQNTIQGNSIFNNGALGIDLSPDNVTANDTNDPDTGANNRQNFPILNLPTNSGGNTNISGTLNSAPSTQYRLEFFSSPVCDPSGFGEGQTFLDTINVTTGAGGSVNFAHVVPAIPAGHFLTATATAPNGDTSEFAECGQEGPPTVSLVFNSATIDDSLGNSNGQIDVNECVSLNVELRNRGAVTATGISATLSSLSPGVTVNQATSTYPNIAMGNAAPGNSAFQISVAPDFGCGNPIELRITATTDQGVFTVDFQLPTTLPSVTNTFNSAGPPVPIPDDETNAADMPITVSGITGPITKVRVKLHITHELTEDLDVSLIGPDGTQVFLSFENGDDANFGTNCPADGNDTIFDDDATTEISDGTNPYVGTFEPDDELAAFINKSGSAVNGTWNLHVEDFFSGNSGTIQCWSLEIISTPATASGFSATGPIAIPDINSAGAELPVTVSGVTGPIAKVLVNLHLTHGSTDDLDISLVGPDGTTINLSDDNGTGANYGTDCPAGPNDTTFDDEAEFSITVEDNPFSGSFRPEQALSAFNGKFGSAVNGNWKLVVADDEAGTTGSIECWTLTILTVNCTSGGGECAVPTAPEMDVEGNGVSIADGDATPSATDHTDFGSVAVSSGTVVRTFTIENTGTANLNLTGTPKVVVTGTHAGDFSVTPQPSSPVNSGGGTTTFDVSFDPSGPGLRSATLSIDNDDNNENPYNFAIQGVGTAETSVALTSGNLIVTDITNVTNDSLTISLNGANTRVNDPSNTLECGAGTTQVDQNTCDVPTSSITGNIQINTLAGNDTLTLNLTSGDLIPAAGLSYAGGDPATGPGDKLIISGGSQGTVNYNYTNAHDGSVVMSNFGTVSYTGLEPITNSGTASDIVFNLPTGPNAVTLGDDGTSANAMSRLSGATFELTDFANPTGSLTILRGNSADTLSINALPDFNASLTVGAGATPFTTISVNGTVAVTGTAAINFNAANVTGAGNISNGGGLTVNNTGASSTLSGVIAGTGALIKQGTGTLNLAGTNTYSGATNINSGRLNINGSTNSNTSVNSTGTLGGTGTLDSSKTVSVNSGGTAAPGSSPGILNTGSVTFQSSGTFEVEIGGTAPGNTASDHDQLNVTGAVSPNDATLSLSAFGGFTPSAGQSFVIINNDSTDSIATTFNGLAEGATISNFLGSALNATITYQGGTDNNDVVLTAVAPPAAPEINVKGNSITIVDGDNTPDVADHTDFGGAPVSGGTVQRTFTIENSGTTDLNVSGIAMSGGAAGDFTIGALTPASPIPAGNSATFTLTFDPSVQGVRTSTVIISNNDTNESSYDFAVQGIGGINISINDGRAAEPATGTNQLLFTVVLSEPASAAGVSVNYATADDSGGPNPATGGGACGGSVDYQSTNGILTFAPGEQIRTVAVDICADGTSEPDETLLLNLSSPSGGLIVDGQAVGTITQNNTPGTLLISELRAFGPGPSNDPADEFVEIYNNTDSDITVPAAGYGLFKMGADCDATPVLVGTIPATTVIPRRGHFLFAGSGYSLNHYGGTNAAQGDALLSADIEANSNLALFSTTDVGALSTNNRFDAVGFGSNNNNVCDLLREGSNQPALTTNLTSLGEHSYFRKMCEWIQGQGCTVPGIPKDTNDNSVDFWLADTGAITGRLGAPGPENLGSPIRRDNAGISMVQLDGNVAAAAHPNRTRNTSEGAGSTPTQFGTMTLRYRVTNNTGAPVTRLRYRVVDISTAMQSPGPTADLRALTSIEEDGGVGNFPQVGPVQDSATCTSQGLGSPCTVTVRATTLETPPAQAAGGGYNSTLSSGTITTGNALAPGASILINFKLGVEKTGLFRFYIIIEALP